MERPGSDVGKGELSVVVRERLLVRGLILAGEPHQDSGNYGSGLVNDGTADASCQLCVGKLFAEGCCGWLGARQRTLGSRDGRGLLRLSQSWRAERQQAKA